MEKIKLFCLPYAGGSASVYYKFKRYMTDGIELCPVELAGRGSRISQPCYDTLEQAADDVYGIIKNKIEDAQYAIFGHSLGSILAFEVIRRLKANGDKAPVHAFLSGSRPPHRLNKDKPLHGLPDDLFIKEILALGGTDKDVFQNEELRKYFVPLLKADFRIVENYKFDNKFEKLNIGITIFNGKNDKITNNEMQDWQMYTSGAFNLYEFEGNHFFINTHTKEVAKIINLTLFNR